ncbi:MAG: hypothetical protein ACK5XN_23960 [Bacteroidota bacterium]|jgi:hypothetical protein
MAENRNRKHSEASEYFFCTHITPSGEVWELLFTAHEIEEGRRRAARNPEDTFETYIVLQGTKGDPTPEPQEGTISLNKEEADNGAS